ncbi:MAG: NAD-dependent deacylase [Candidatus Aminicenantes bacterium]|nr:NAD-dependent deacylase [Candidatus Aminicenantes bacterium]
MKVNQKENVRALVSLLKEVHSIAVSTGAGISAESGIPTFRGKDGLWKQFRAEELATPNAFMRDPKLVWEWYDWRRGIIGGKSPNPGHFVLAEWEKLYPEFTLITQNIDGLHAKAGSRNILELHGNIWKVRCTQKETVMENFDAPLKEIPPLCPKCGALLRPHVVWFGESLPTEVIHEAFRRAETCEVLFVIGSSTVVQPAASLPFHALEEGAKVVEINLEPTPLTSSANFSFLGKAGEILPMIDKALKE